MDLEAFSAALMEAHQGLWLIAAGITGDRALADDIVQEAAVVAVQKLERFVPGTNFRAWMARIVRLTALNHLKKQHRRRTIPFDSETLDRHAAAPAAQSDSLQLDSWRSLPPDQQLFDDRVVDALATLSEDARVCLLLRTVEEMPYAEIAQMLEIAEGTAMSHVHRAKQQLRDRLRHYSYARQEEQ